MVPRRVDHQSASRLIGNPNSVLVLFGLILVTFLVASSAQAQITASGLNTVVVKNGTVYEITGGTRPGNGPLLFHGFGEFSNTAVETARFQTAPSNLVPVPDPTVSNILGAVGGGNPSSIFGAIDSLTYYPNANLFLLNPAGIIFGPNATLNVGGTAHFTTADYIRLADNALFNAIRDPTADALLSMLPIAAFGFFGTNTGALTVQGSQLSVPNGTGISLTSNSITIQAGTLSDGTIQRARLNAPRGHIGLAALSGPGEIAQTSLVPLANTLGEFPVDATSVRVAGNSSVDTTGTGRVHIQGGQFVLDIQQALLTTAPPGTPVAVDNINLSGNGSFMRNSTFSGPGIEATVAAQSIELADGAQFISRAEGVGPGGGITINASSVKVDGASINSILEPFDFVFEELRGPSLTFDVGNLTLKNGGSVTASSSDLFGIGSPLVSGTITINASDTVKVEGISASGAFSKIESLTNSGIVGDIMINPSKLLVTQSGRINSEAEPGQAGKILINATDSITITDGGKIRMNTSDVGGGLVDLFAPSIQLDQAIVQTLTVGAGDAAPVQLRGGTITIAGGQINSQSTEGLGRGGNVSLNATGTIAISGQFAGNSIDPAGPAGIFSTTANQGAPGGNITGTAGQSITISNGATISASSTGAGNAGNITINAAGNFESNGGKISTTATQAQGGDININAGQDVLLSNNTSVSASSTGAGNAGNITAIAGDDFIMQNSSIKTEATLAAGGDIKIGAGDQIQLVNSIISAAVGGIGNGGNITIDPTAVILQNSQIVADAVFGNGGNITIITPVFLADQSSVVSASSQFGQSGTINIQSPTSDLSGTVSSLPSSMRQSASLQTGRCAALASGEASSLIIGGRETLPTEPGGWLPSPLAFLNEGDGLVARGEGQEGLSGLSGRSGLSRLSRLSGSTDPSHQIDQMNQIDQTDLAATGSAPLLSLRRLTPAGFLTQRFAESESGGCRS